MLLRSDAERIEEDGIMEKQIKIKADTLFLPICAGKKTELMECFCEGKKVMELQVPVDIQEKNGYHIDYYARFPVKQFTDKTLILSRSLFWRRSEMTQCVILPRLIGQIATDPGVPESILRCRPDGSTIPMD